MGDLKPCPFCGGKGVPRNAEAYNRWSVSCDSCWVTVDSQWSEASAADKWNRRATHPQPVTPAGGEVGLLCFVAEVMDEWYEGDLDGGQRQDLALKYGLLDEVRVTEACGDLCQCAEYGDFPQMCYRPSSLLKQCRAAREKPARAAIDAALNQRGGGE